MGHGSTRRAARGCCARDLGDAMRGKYILDGHRAIPVDDLFDWAHWLETADRRVALTKISSNVKVSTVFLGLDHNWGLAGPPAIFETMVFGGPMDQEQDRYSTWEQAEAGHEAMVAKVRACAARV